MRLKICQIIIISYVLFWPASPGSVVNFHGVYDTQERISLISEYHLCAGNSGMPNHPDSQLVIASDAEKIWELFERKQR